MDSRLYGDQTVYCRIFSKILSDDPEKRTAIAADMKKTLEALSDGTNPDIAILGAEMGHRTTDALRAACADGWPVRYDPVEGFYLTFKNGKGKTKKYSIISGQTTDFHATKMISIGSNKTREIILFDPTEDVLINSYAILVDELQKLNFKTWQDKVRHVIKFVRMQLGANLYEVGELEDWTRRFCESTDHAILFDRKFISIARFIEENLGLCRHHNLLLAFYLDSLQNDGILPKCSVHCARYDLTNAAHAWVMLHEDATDELYLIDSLWDRFGLVTDPELGKDYPDEVLIDCIRRFNHSTTERSVIDPDEKERKDPRPSSDSDFSDFEGSSFEESDEEKKDIRPSEDSDSISDVESSFEESGKEPESTLGLKR